MKSLAKAGSWGTHVELQAASDCFNVTVYVCSPNQSGIVRWEKIAVPRHNNTIKRPALTLMPIGHLDRLELLLSFSHYQSVVPYLENTKLMPPTIIYRSSGDVICIADSSLFFHTMLLLCMCVYMYMHFRPHRTTPFHSFFL